MGPKRSTGYSADAITLSIGLMSIDSGRGPDEFLEITEEGESVVYSQGLDGEGVFSYMPAGATRLKITLLQTSQGNSNLSGLKLASDAAGGIAYPVAWEDSRGTSKGAGAAGAIIKWPDEKFGKEAGTVVWEVLVHQPARFVGGH